LEAEAIRDSLLATSGRLDTTRSGPPVSGNSPRRSVYLRVQRNNLDPVLTTFDAPDPLTTRGRRNVTNVPAQSLALLNNPFVKNQAAAFASSLDGDPRQRVDQLFTRAFARTPSPDETNSALAFVARIQNSGATVRQQIAETNAQLHSLEAARTGILAPVRQRLEAERRSNKTEKTTPSTPAPVASFGWGSGNHSHQLTAHHSARVENGAAVLDGGGHFTSPPLATALGEKTLEAIVQLDTLNQQGGGVVTVQTNDGDTFDSIVFAERDTNQWLAGSDNHRRTGPFNAPQESTATREPVHLAITYSADGTITAYRNGQPYGSPTRRGNLHRYSANNYHLAVGLRHGPPTTKSGDRLLRGRVLKAALYDRVLTPGDIAALASGDSSYVSETAVLDTLTKPQKKQLEALETSLTSARQTLENLEKNNTTPDPWQTLAHSLYNLKEFIYLR
ncbi:MAG: DUF1553 domain-containing protein, partial [Verrucomicrobiales bacterium]|nr:DUF1553 domain-containing protein [Verrucomicrobiales bacterium]